MMFKTHVGPVDDDASISYLRPETAQGIFTNFKNVVDSFYPDMPFGIAQQGKAFRNEISPRDFVFRSREFEQMEIEYFIDPANWEAEFEVDDRVSEVGRVGRQYVLDRFDLNYEDILRRLHHLCESVGWRMRKQGLAARGVYVYAKADSGYWHACHVYSAPMFSNRAIYDAARELFRTAPSGIREIGMHCYKLQKGDSIQQLGLFMDEVNRERSLVRTADDVNSRYGERTIVAADTINTGMYISQKIPFGSTRYL
jgi:hypothetical protein